MVYSLLAGKYIEHEFFKTPFYDFKSLHKRLKTAGYYNEEQGCVRAMNFESTRN